MGTNQCVVVLLAKLETLHRQQYQTEHEIAETKGQIVATTKKTEPKPRRKRRTRSKVADLDRDLLKVLQGAGEPLPPREIASRLGIAPAALGYRLRQAVTALSVEKIGFGRYRISSAVPTLL